MLNLKPQVFQALTTDAALLTLLGGPRVYFGFPPDPAVFPRVTYYELGNEPEIADGAEYRAEVTIMIDIWHTASTSEITATVNRIMSGIDFVRDFATDLFESGPKGKSIYRKSTRWKVSKKL